MKRNYETPPTGSEAEDTKSNTLTKLAAVLALSAVALTGCTTNNAEAKDNKTTTQETEAPKETETPEPTKEIGTYKTEVPRFRSPEEWKVNDQALIDLADTFEELGDSAYTNPEFRAQQAAVRDEFLANNPVPGDVPRPEWDQDDIMSPLKAKEVLEYFNAVEELYRQWLSDDLRASSIDEMNGVISEKDYEEDLAVAKGLDVALFNGIKDDVSGARFTLYFDNVAVHYASGSDKAFPTIKRAIDLGNAEGGGAYAPMPHAVAAIGIIHHVEVDGVAVPGRVLIRFDYNQETNWPDLTAEFDADTQVGTKLAEY